MYTATLPEGHDGICCHFCTERARVMQTAAIAEVLKGGDVLLASHTGSGKTLAYLLPLVRCRISKALPCRSCFRPQRGHAFLPACYFVASHSACVASKHCSKSCAGSACSHVLYLPSSLISCRHDGAAKHSAVHHNGHQIPGPKHLTLPCMHR